MSKNLNLLLQNYCQPATVTGERILFPLEKESEQGKALLAKAPTTLLHLQKFSPCGLQQTYRDKATGAELPVFAVFDLEGNHQVVYEITTDSLPPVTTPHSLPAYLPLRRTQDFVRKINERRMKAGRMATRISSILGIFPALLYLFSHAMGWVDPTALSIVAGAWIAGAFLSYLVSVLLLNRFCAWKKLVITAEFNGIIPKEAREKARAARDHFDKLYLLVDQQHRWKSAFLPDPRPRALDPLLIGERRQGRRHQFFLIDQFDLTEAEQYLGNEFARKPA